MCRTIWEVDFFLEGDVTIAGSLIELEQEKGFSINQFYSQIKIKKHSKGLKVSLTAYAQNQNDAYTVAFVYLERVINTLSVLIQQPLRLLPKYEVGKSNISTTRRRLSEEDFRDAFTLSRRFERSYLELLNAISWYAKGNNDANVINSFIAYWTCIEILAVKYHTRTERTEMGVKNKIYQSYIDYLGEQSTENSWVDDAYILRNKLVHGGLEVTYEEIVDIENRLEDIKNKTKDLLIKIIETEVSWHIR